MYQDISREQSAVQYFNGLQDKIKALMRVGDVASSRKRRKKAEVEEAYASVRELIEEGMSAKAACLQEGVFQSNYSKHAREKGWKTAPQAIPGDIVELCKRCRREGMNWKEIGKLASRDPQTLRRHVGDCTKERALWIDSWTDKAIERLKEGESIQNVADSMGVSYSLLSNRLKKRGFNRKEYLTSVKKTTTTK